MPFAPKVFEGETTMQTVPQSSTLPRSVNLWKSKPTGFAPSSPYVWECPACGKSHYPLSASWATDLCEIESVDFLVVPTPLWSLKGSWTQCQE